jgi:DNA gyrase subunit B
MAYDINSIESLSFREGVRKRIQMYLGSDDIEGTYQALKEIINNSTDEALAGYGKKIEIEVDELLNAVSVRDYGRGVPFGIREDGENVLVSIYTKSHTGGKFSNDSYKNASGLNGIGGSCVCLSSSQFSVTSYRDKKQASAYFAQGELVDYEEGSTILPNGTLIIFTPDPEVFCNGEIGFSYERICNDIKNISYVYSGITFEVKGKLANGEVVKASYCAKNGITDFVKDNIPKALHSTIMTASAETEADSVEIAFQWGTGKEKSYVFVNGLLCPEGGTPITGAKGAITKTVNNLANASFDGDKIREGLFYVVNCKVANPSFANQTKSKINNPSLRTLTSNAFTTALKEMAANHSNEFNTVVALLRKIEKADEAAERARNAILNQEKKEAASKKRKVQMPDKFKDCEKHGEDSLLIVCEGNSALAGLMPARDVNTEALYAVRGKVKNLLKHPLEECLENQEISDIICALGCGIQDRYNPKKLNYGKVAIAVDADVDGKNIMCLIATMFAVLMPEFIAEGRLCWLQAPLYRLTNGNKRVFAYNEKELAELRKKYPTWEQGRNKGLGEMTAEDMELSMMSKENRHLEVLKIEDFDSAMESLNILMGAGRVKERRDFLFENVDFGALYE